MSNINFKHLFQGMFDILNSWITEFYQLAVFKQYMIMLFETIRFLVLGEVFAKLVFAYEITFYKKVKRIIHSSPANPVIFILHADV